jgi:hypothetical protein
MKQKETREYIRDLYIDFAASLYRPGFSIGNIDELELFPVSIRDKRTEPYPSQAKAGS